MSIEDEPVKIVLKNYTKLLTTGKVIFVHPKIKPAQIERFINGVYYKTSMKIKPYIDFVKTWYTFWDND